MCMRVVLPCVFVCAMYLLFILFGFCLQAFEELVQRILETPSLVSPPPGPSVQAVSLGSAANAPAEQGYCC